MIKADRRLFQHFFLAKDLGKPLNCLGLFGTQSFPYRFHWNIQEGSSCIIHKSPILEMDMSTFGGQATVQATGNLMYANA